MRVPSSEGSVSTDRDQSQCEGSAALASKALRFQRDGDRGSYSFSSIHRGRNGGHGAGRGGRFGGRGAGRGSQRQPPSMPTAYAAQDERLQPSTIDEQGYVYLCWLVHHAHERQRRLVCKVAQGADELC